VEELVGCAEGCDRQCSENLIISRSAASVLSARTRQCERCVRGAALARAGRRQRSVALEIRKQSGSNTVGCRRGSRRNPRLNTSPGGATLRVVATPPFHEESVADVQTTLILGALSPYGGYSSEQLAQHVITAHTPISVILDHSDAGSGFTPTSDSMASRWRSDSSSTTPSSCAKTSSATCSRDAITSRRPMGTSEIGLRHGTTSRS